MKKLGTENKENGQGKNLNDLIVYFRDAGKYIDKEFATGKRGEHFSDKATRYQELSQELIRVSVLSAENQFLREDVLADALACLKEDFDIALSKGPSEGGKTFSFKKEDISQLIDFIRSELGLKSAGLTEEEIKKGELKLRNITIK